MRVPLVHALTEPLNEGRDSLDVFKWVTLSGF
jgi:hypothetical protein